MLLEPHYADSKVHGTNMGPIWGRQDPGGPMLAPWTLLSGEWDANISSGYGLVPSEVSIHYMIPIVSHIYVAIWRH